MKPAVWIILLLTTAASAQNKPTSGWTPKVTFFLGLTQAGFSNWAKGGENALAWQSTLNTRFTDNRPKYNWENKGRFTYGMSKIGNSGTRKTADEIKIETVYTRKTGLAVNPFVSASALTQFAPGYTYGDTTKTQVSRFLDPAYFTQSAGMGYSRGDTLKLRLGAAMQETYTRRFNAYADNPKTPKIEKTRIEGGISAAADVNRKLSQNIVYAAELNIFSNLKAFDQIDVNWTNLFTAKVAKYINVTLGVDLVYDKNTIDKWQIREALSAGFTYDIF